MLIFLGLFPQVSTISSTQKCLLNQQVPFPHLLCACSLFLDINVNLIYKNIFILHACMCSWKSFFPWESKVFGNSEISMTVAELYNQTAQRNVKRTAFQLQAWPNIHPPCVYSPYLNNEDSNASLIHLLCTKINKIYQLSKIDVNNLEILSQ